MEPGLFVTFFDENEPRDRELPPVGPLDRIVLRERQLVTERGSIHQPDDLGVGIDRWLEGELELQRATGEEPGGTKRPSKRFTALDGVFVRFVAFGEARERENLPEFGPFAVVSVGPSSVEADGQQLASRAAGEPAQWELTPGAGPSLAGLRRPDIAFRTTTGAYHPSLPPAPARAVPREPVVAPTPPPMDPPFVLPPIEPPFTLPPIEPPFTLPPRIELPTPPPRIDLPFTPPVESAPVIRPQEEPRASTPPALPTPPAKEPPALVARDLEHIERIDRDRADESLRARMVGAERRRLIADEPISDEASTWATRYRPQAATGDGFAGEVVEEGGLSFGAALWRMRFVIIGILFVFAGLYAFIVIRTGGGPTVPQVATVNVGARFSGTRWDWSIDGVQRMPDAGKVKAQGVFYVVHVATVNKSTEGAQLSPGDFTLIDANGVSHTALGLGSGVYQGADNSGSPNIWPATFPVGRNVTFNVLFDIDPSLPHGMALELSDVPKTRVHLD